MPNITNGLVDLAIWGNNTTNGLLGPFILLAIFVLSFSGILIARGNAIESLAFSGFITGVFGFFLWQLTLLNGWIVLFCFVLGGVTALLAHFGSGE